MSLVDDAIKAIESVPASDIASLVDGLCGCIPPLLPLVELIKLLQAVTEEIAAKTRLEEMKAAVKAVDASVDAAEEEALKAGQWP